jgi:hypothetical protein
MTLISTRVRDQWEGNRTASVTCPGRDANCARRPKRSSATQPTYRHQKRQQCWPKIKLTPRWCGIACSVDRYRLPTPAEPERVAPVSASQSGIDPRVRCTRTALATAPFSSSKRTSRARARGLPSEVDQRHQVQKLGIVRLCIEGSLECELGLENPPRAQLAEVGIAMRSDVAAHRSNSVEFIVLEGQSSVRRFIWVADRFLC